MQTTSNVPAIAATVAPIATSGGPFDVSPANVAKANPPKLATSKATRKPKAPATAKPAKAAPVAVKPASKPKADNSARVALIGTMRSAVSRIYNGPSLTVRSATRTTASTVYSALLASPKHRTTLAKLTVRDESALRLICDNLKAGAFDPSALNVDCGNFSRLCSVGYIVAGANGSFRVTPKAIEANKLASKRAA